MKTLRNILYKVLGLENYLRLVSRIYLCLVMHGFLRRKYPELFYLRKIIKPGFNCIDIGANLGYYSVFLSKYAGNGKVFSVEPVPLFASVLKRNMLRSGKANMELLPYALGASNGKIKMGLPEKDGVLHHGMTKVASSANENYIRFFEAEMRIPDELFSKLLRLDFIKCDVEGYEYHVFSNMKEILKKFKPLVQSELGGKENRSKVIALFEDMGYTTCLLRNNELVQAIKEEKTATPSDFYFLQEGNIVRGIYE